MSDRSETPGLNDLEAALGALAPRASALDRDVLMYWAGRASAGRRWQWATLVSTGIAAALAVALLVRPPAERIASTPPVPEVVSPPVSDPAPFFAGPGLAMNFRLQEQVLSHGLDGLPPLPTGPDPAGPVSTADLLRGL